jgi:hypothetical protein
MKRLLDRIFKKEPQLNYIFAEYRPVEMNLPSSDARLVGGDCDEAENIEAIAINKVDKSGVV